MALVPLPALFGESPRSSSPPSSCSSTSTTGTPTTRRPCLILLARRLAAASRSPSARRRPPARAAARRARSATTTRSMARPPGRTLAGRCHTGWVWTTRDAAVSYRKRCADRGRHCDAIRAYSVDVLDALAYGVDATVVPTELPTRSATAVRSTCASSRASTLPTSATRRSSSRRATWACCSPRSSLCTAGCASAPRARRLRARARGRRRGRRACRRERRRAGRARRGVRRALDPRLLLAAAARTTIRSAGLSSTARGGLVWDVLHIALLAGALGAILFFVPCLIDELGAAARVGDAPRPRVAHAARSARARAPGGAATATRGPPRGAGLLHRQGDARRTARARRGRRLHRRAPALAQTGVPRVGNGLCGHGIARARVPRRARRLLFRVRRAARRAARARVRARAAHAAARRAVAARERGRRRGRARRGRDRGRAYPWPSRAFELPLVASLVNGFAWSVALPLLARRRERVRRVVVLLRCVGEHRARAVRAAAAAHRGPESSCCSTDFAPSKRRLPDTRRAVPDPALNLTTLRWAGSPAGRRRRPTRPIRDPRPRPNRPRPRSHRSPNTSASRRLPPCRGVRAASARRARPRRPHLRRVRR